MSNGTKSLFTVLHEQSQHTARRIADGERLGVRQHEETITESLLLEVAKAFPSIRVQTFTRAQESRETGADWVWWWEGKTHWFGSLVQAKRLVPKAGGQHGYDFNYRPKRSKGNPNPPRQIDLLLEDAERRGLPAIYALYNGPDFTIDRQQWSCGILPFSIDSMGVAVLPALMAENWSTIDTSMESIGPLSRPLPCQVCPPTCRDRGDPWLGPLPWILDGSSSEVRNFFTAEQTDNEAGPGDYEDVDLAVAAARGVLLSLAQMGFEQYRARGYTALDPLVRYVWKGVRLRPPDYVLRALEGDDPEAIDDPGYSRLVVVRRPQ